MPETFCEPHNQESLAQRRRWQILILSCAFLAAPGCTGNGSGGSIPESGAFPSAARVSLDPAAQKLLPRSADSSGQPPKAIVLVAFLRGCPVLRRYYPELRALAAMHPKMQFLLLSQEAGGHLGESKAELSDYKVELRLLEDPEQVLTKAAGLRTASEVAVVSLPANQIVYRGAIDDAVQLDFQKPRPGKRYLHDILERLEAGIVPAFSSTRATGCALTFRNGEPAPASQ